MKKIILMGVALIGFNALFAQNGDTTKLNIGETKIIIIDKNDEKSKEEKLDQARKEFERLLAEKQKNLDEHTKKLEEMRVQLENQQKELANQQDELQRQQSELKVQEMNKEVEGMNKKVEELNKEVSALNKGISELDKNDDFADDDNDEWDNTKHDWKNNKNWKGSWDNMVPFGDKDKFMGHWAGIELGLNNYVTSDGKLEMTEANNGFELDAGRSWGFSLNFMEFNIPFGKFAGITTGIGMTWNNYKFSNNVNFYKDTVGVMVATPEDVKSYNKNSFHTWNFTVPLILEFQLPSKEGNSGIYLSFGGYASFKALSWGKLEYSLDGVDYKERRSSDFLINNFRYGLTARVGLKYLRFFANYDLVPLFKKDHGPEVYPVSIGVTLASF